MPSARKQENLTRLLMLKIDKISDFCHIIYSERASVMAGCPSDVLKTLASKHIEVPLCIAVPDMFFQYGLNVAATEFPVARFLYGPSHGDRLRIIGGRGAVERQRTIIGETFPFVPGAKAPKWASNPSTEKFLRYDEYFRSMKAPRDGVQFVPVGRGGLWEGDILVEKTGANSFRFTCSGESAEIDVSGNGLPAPFFSMPRVPFCRPVRSGVTIIGSGSGFSPYEENTSCIVWADYMPVCIDGSAWQGAFLRSLGVDPSSVPVYFLTHNHDDHSTILDLVSSQKKVTLMTTAEIFESFLVKSSATLGVPRRLFEKGFNFIPVVPGEPVECYGIRFEAHETVHSVPCVGVRINGSILVSGDTAFGSVVRKMESEGLVSAGECERICSIPVDPVADYVFMDAGGAPVHPDVSELSVLPAESRKKLILNHVSVSGVSSSDFPNPGLFGMTFIADRGYMPLSADRAADLFSGRILREAGPFWQKSFLSRGRLRRFGQGAGIRLSGHVGIVVDGIVRGPSGSLFRTGEIAGAWGDGDFCSESESRLLLVDRGLFDSFIRQSGLSDRVGRWMMAEREACLIAPLRRFSQDSIIEASAAFRAGDFGKGERFRFRNALIRPSADLESVSGRIYPSGRYSFAGDESFEPKAGVSVWSVDLAGLGKIMPRAYVVAMTRDMRFGGSCQVKV